MGKLQQTRSEIGAEFDTQRNSVNSLVRTAITSLMPENASQPREGMGLSGGKNSVLNPSDFKVEKLHENPKPEQCRRWMKELGIYLEARPGWLGMKALLHQLRLCKPEVTTADVFEELLNKASADPKVDILDWKFSERASVLYTLVHNKLPESLNNAISMVDDSNGVELLRMVMRECDPMAEGQREVMLGKINAMAGEDCKKFNDTYVSSSSCRTRRRRCT